MTDFAPLPRSGTSTARTRFRADSSQFPGHARSARP
jgi:hypothetical protein